MPHDALLIMTIAAGALTLAGFLARWLWLCELTSHFRVQYAVALAACAAGWLWLGSPLAWLAATGMGLNLLVIAPCFARPRAGSADGPTVRLMTVNVNGLNRSYDRMREVIRHADVDVVVFSEIHEQWLAGLEPLSDVYRYGKAMLFEGRGLGIALMSRLPLERVEIRPIGPAKLPSVVATFSIDGRPVTVIGAHTLAPVRRDFARLRNAHLEALGRLAQAQTTPVILLGDLNNTPWSPFFSDLLRAGRLRDSRAGFGLHATWPDGWPRLLRIPIDHCLVSDRVHVRARRLGPSVGSDHLPVIVEVSLTP